MTASVFIGSSSEGLPIAFAIQQELHRIATTVVWSQGTFSPTNVPIENLFVALDKFDFAVFVFLPEDELVHRKTNVLAIRDNVIFEAGLFLAKLGRDRVYFVAPENAWIDRLHLPSDFAGLLPSTFAPQTGNDQAAVGPALYHLKNAILKFNTASVERIVYETKESIIENDFVFKNSYVYKDREPVGNKSDSYLRISPTGIFQLERKNLEGRCEIELRPHDARDPSLERAVKIPQRILHVTCEARVEGGQHSVQFVWKDIENDWWVANRLFRVWDQNWVNLEFVARVPAVVDLLFRIDNLAPTATPSSLFLRKLKIVDRYRG
jgi:hypothetical protein